MVIFDDTYSFQKMEEFVGFILVLKWLLFTGGKLTCAGYNISIYLLANRTASYVCETQSLYCQQKEHILLSQITFYTVNGCNFCGCNGSLTIFDKDPTDFKYEFYDKCSYKSHCNFSSTVQITSQKRRSWLAVVEYECILSEPINSTLCCNCDRNSTETNATTASLSTVTGLLTSEHTTSTSTSERESTIFHSSTIEMATIETTYSPSSEITKDITPDVASKSPKEISSDSRGISSAAIIGGGSGGIAFVILVVAVVCVVIKRKRSIQTRAGRGNEAYKNVYYNEKTTASPVTNGVVNLSYEDQTVHGDRELLHSNGDANVNEYTDPFDVSTSPPGARETEKSPKDITNKSNNMYEEPYNGPTVPESRSLSGTYAKPLKLVESPLVKSENREDYLNKNLTDASEYSHLAPKSHPKFDDAPENQYNHIHDIDNTLEDYSHIHDVDNTSEDQYNHIDNAYLTKVKDNYSHILLKSTKPGTDKQQSSGSVEQYSHLGMYVFNNSTSGDEEKDNHSLHNYYNVDITDHDHVALTEL